MTNFNSFLKFNIKTFPLIKTAQSRIIKLTPWLMEPGGSMPHSQGHSNNPYPKPNQPNSSYLPIP